jgi:hypothetical protein
MHELIHTACFVPHYAIASGRKLSYLQRRQSMSEADAADREDWMMFLELMDFAKRTAAVSCPCSRTGCVSPEL